MNQDYLRTVLNDGSDHPFFKRPDLLEVINQADISSDYLAARKSKLSFLNRETWSSIFDLFKTLPVDLIADLTVIDGAVTLSGLNGLNLQPIRDLAVELIPWRKGPWKIDSLQIEAEWRSDIKYEKLSKIRNIFSGKTIADIGGGNGYYGFRSFLDGAKYFVVFDPSEKFFFQFELMQKFLRLPNIQFELGGYKEAALTKIIFDVVYCLGVFYHQKNPFELIDCCSTLLNKSGHLVLETMITEGEELTILFPKDRYAKARNVYFLPTISAISAILERAGYKNIDVLDISSTTTKEQRKTAFMPYESLSDFLDPNDPSKTIEGYPSPKRALFVAEKK